MSLILFVLTMTYYICDVHYSARLTVRNLTQVAKNDSRLEVSGLPRSGTNLSKTDPLKNNIRTLAPTERKQPSLTAVRYVLIPCGKSLKLQQALNSRKYPCEREVILRTTK